MEMGRWTRQAGVFGRLWQRDGTMDMGVERREG